ncbi:hypothetical protein B0A79_24080 [Flavobacterium piscis]|uniref:Uncharacterized protein n=1 Tax=Flavobacterium piscis TaxID=1114874 RepID=A0ABX2XJ07_9FLAO|nr:hypothetical protein [Flavobacterium piscis]OCB73840.1 hypothetical protein FLP_14305 [Flavobacterium piscis]OXE95797.1 hypothetical protein B0A79_24080 [Flavobacterium piscis]
MYTHSDAVKIFKYYSDKVIGFPLDESKGKSLLINNLRIDELGNNQFDVICIGIGSASIHFFRDIHSVAKDLGLPLPKDILEE